MNPRTVAVTVVIAASALLAACDRPTPSGEATGGTTPRSVPGSPAGSPQQLPNTAPSTSAPTATERQSSVQPVEGQVDAKQVEQQKDFKHPQEGQAPQKSN